MCVLLHLATRPRYDFLCFLSGGDGLEGQQGELSYATRVDTRAKLAVKRVSIASEKHSSEESLTVALNVS